MLCYPLASTLLLLSAVLKKPDSTSQTHVDRIEGFIKLLQEIQSNGSDIQKLLSFCQKIYSIASLTINDARRAEASFRGTGAVANLEVCSPLLPILLIGVVPRANHFSTTL
jgi:hypothetical protein